MAHPLKSVATTQTINSSHDEWSSPTDGKDRALVENSVEEVENSIKTGQDLPGKIPESPRGEAVESDENSALKRKSSTKQSRRPKEITVVPTMDSAEAPKPQKDNAKAVPQSTALIAQATPVGGAQRNGTSLNATLAVTSSAAAALRARKGAREAGSTQARASTVPLGSATPATDREIEPNKRAQKTTGILQPLSSNARGTVERETISHRFRAAQDPTIEKPKALIGRTTGTALPNQSTAAKPPTEVLPSKSTKNSVDENDNTGSGSTNTKAGGRLKRPAEEDELSASIYDLPSSSADVERPAKRSRTTKQAARRKQRGAAAAPSKALEAIKPRTRAVMLREKKQRERDEIGQRNKKTEVNGQDVTIPAASTGGAAESIKTSQPRPQNAGEHSTYPVGVQSDSMGDTAFVQQSLFSEDQALARNQEPSKPVRELPLDIRTASKRVQRSSDDIQTRGRPAPAPIGMSQDNPVELSDDVRSSPLGSSPPLQRFPPHGPDATQNATGSRDADPIPRTPETTNPYHPSLACKYPLEHSGRLVNSSHERKSNIISFSKSGPLNQGQIPLKVGVSDSARKNALSDAPPSAAPVSDITRREMVLQSGQKLDGLVAARKVQSNEITDPTIAAFDAAELPDALAGFLKTPQAFTANKRTANRQNSLPDACEQDLQPRSPEDGFQPIDDFEGPTLFGHGPISEPQQKERATTERTLSQLQMPPPISRAVIESHRKPDILVPVNIPDSRPPPAVDSERSSRRIDELAGNAHALSVGLQANRLLLLRKNIETQSISKQSAASNVAVDHPSQGEQGAARAEMHDPQLQEPSKRERTKATRNASRNSQSVDLHGSPVPEGMLVPEQATVLETFSQQTDIPSDAPANEDLRGKGKENVARLNAMSTKAALRSNTSDFNQSDNNLRLSPPCERGAAVERVVRFEPRQTGPIGQTASTSTDPSTGSYQTHKPPSDSSKSSLFMDQLRRGTLGAEAMRPEAVVPHPHKTVITRPVGSSLQASKVTRTVTGSTDSSDVSSDAPDEPDAVQDVGLWRSALQPYQMNLFDELVTVSHRIVRHLVGKDTAATDIVDDYRRRATTIVEQMELSHAKQYDSHVEKMKERKLRLRREFETVGERLKQSMSVVETAKRERTAHGTGERYPAERLRTVLADFC